jgi:hypothetical protein
VNEAGTATCSSCGFAARATGAQIEHARAVRAGISNPRVRPAPDVTASIQAALTALPPYRKIPAIIGGLLAVAGSAWFKVTFSWSGAALSALIFVAGLLLVAWACSGTAVQEGSRDAG